MEGVGKDLYADRRGSALAMVDGGRATRRERTSGLPWRERSKPLPKPAVAAADLKPTMTERAEGAAEMGAVCVTADGIGRTVL